MGLGHDHGGSAASRHTGALRRALLLSASVLALQVVGGAVSGSLALLADAGHTFADVAGLVLTLVAIGYAQRQAPPSRTFGHYRVEVFTAGVNGLILLGVAGFVLFEAWQRWNEPVTVRSGLMLVVALAAVAANLGGVFLLRRGAQESLTVKAAYLEVLGDLLGSAAVVAAAVVLALTGWTRADVVASVLIALLIVPRAVSLLRETYDVLVEAAPRGIDLDEVRRHIVEVPGVVEVHDLHAWTITSGMPVLSAHVVVSDEVLADGFGGSVLDRLGECLHDCFEVEHCTFQLEPVGHRDHEHPGHP